MNQRSNHEEDFYIYPPHDISTGKRTNSGRKYKPKKYMNETADFRNSITYNKDNNDVGNLEEFGLSYYEAKAYVTLIGKGSLSASEIAYYSRLPRTKIYLTLKKLEKKGLSVVSQQKPLICSAINPKEAFEEILTLHEQRLKNMRKVIDKLQQLNEKSNYIKGLEEKRYFILDPKSTFERLTALIENSRTSITAILDIWGLRLISKCRQSLIRAINKGIKIQLLISNQCLGHDNLISLPNEIMVKVGNIFSNIVIIDSNNIINIDGGNGKAALFTSIDVLGFSYMKTFEEEWNKAVEVHGLSDIDPVVQLKAIRLTKFIEETMYDSHSQNLSIDNSKQDLDFQENTKCNELQKFFEYGNKGSQVGSSSLFILEMMRKMGIDLDLNQDDFFKIMDLALNVYNSGSVKFDKNNGIITIYSKYKNKSIVVWSFLICSYFENLDYKVETVPKISDVVDFDKIDSFRIKITRS